MKLQINLHMLQVTIFWRHEVARNGACGSASPEGKIFGSGMFECVYNAWGGAVLKQVRPVSVLWLLRDQSAHDCTTTSQLRAEALLDSVVH